MTIEMKSGADGTTAVAQSPTTIVLMASGLKDTVAMRTRETGTRLKVDGAANTAAAVNMGAVNPVVANTGVNTIVVNTAAAVKTVAGN
jgi:hypothetical protein